MYQLRLEIPITDMSNDDWQKIIGINFSSVFYGCKHSIPYLKKQWWINN